MNKRIISILMENAPGALSRVVGLFSQRGYNIESLSVAPTEDDTISRLTLTTIGNDEKIEQITKNLNKIIDVIKLIELSNSAYIERELMMVKLKAIGNAREEIKRSVDIFRGQIIDVTPNIYTVQLVGDNAKLTAFIRAVGEAVVLEVVRTGISGISRGEKVLSL
ncbi:MAG: acetolactate synthase-1/3 small subunit [Candidatus Endobugula sp.]|jgi:acetolactate synthase-1/3 small subunit